MNLRWEQYYKDTPLDEIPWQKNQADYFNKIIDSNKVKPSSVIDLGCGTGMKSIYLAKKGFKVTGIDISKTAINYSKGNAKKAKVKIDFIIADATNLSFLKEKKFDFVLDWSHFHGIPKNIRGKYITELIKHSKKGSKLLLRCFSRDGSKKEFAIRPMTKIYLSSKDDIENLFNKHFKILEINRSKVSGGNPPSKWFNEYLMERL